MFSPIALRLLLLLLLLSPALAATFRSSWADASRLWAGPDWWANPLQDWSLRSGRAFAAAVRNRTLCLTAHSIVSVPTAVTPVFEAAVTLVYKPRRPSTSPVAGFRFGRVGPNPHYLSALLDANTYTDAVISTGGVLSLSRPGRAKQMIKMPPLKSGESIVLSLVVQRVPGNNGAARVVLTAKRGGVEETVERLMKMKNILGGMSLLASSQEEIPGSAAAAFEFHRFALDGRGVSFNAAHKIGPVVSTQYTLSDNVLRVQAQFMPVDAEKNPSRTVARLFVKLDTAPDSAFERKGAVKVHRLSRTATFVVAKWDKRKTWDYVIETRWNGSRYVRKGRIKAEPSPSDKFKIAVFSCDYGYLFPHTDLVSNVKRHNPDMLYFAGDQIYETNDEFGNAKFAATEKAMLDYLRRYYRFLLSWQRVLKDRPSVIVPDDHDVFHGDLFGQGGRTLPLEFVGNRRFINYRKGGYLMPGKWVRAVERTHVGTLPTAATPGIKLPAGIRTYFTTVRYARLSFAVIEDRKFKTGPDSMTPGPDRTRGNGAQLLGTDQEKWLGGWADDWTGHDMKVALSQTILCKAITHSGHNLARSTYLFDSGAWPVDARNRAVSILADARALTLHGDQHLGGVVKLSPDGDRNRNYWGFMVPGTANGWPRAWWPTKEPAGWTGGFKDDAGHYIEMLAVANPDRGSNLLAERLGNRITPAELAYRKGSGYGLVVLDRERKTAQLTLFRVGKRNERPFEGFPKTVYVGGKGGATNEVSRVRGVDEIGQMGEVHGMNGTAVR